MSGRIYKKHENRRKKAKHYIRNNVSFFGFNTERHVDLWMNYHVHHKDLNRLIAINTHWYDFSEEEVIDTINGTLWEAQDKDAAESVSYIGRFLSISAYTHGGGKGYYKTKYHMKRRMEAKQLERAVMIDDEIGFEKISPDGWKGCIGWDIW